MTAVRLGTRGSPLALQQAELVAARLAAAHDVQSTLVIIKTSGDKLAEAPLSEAGGKRLFVKEIEEALLRGEIDIAVHSCKDMPVELAGGLELSAVLPRADPSDALVFPFAAEPSSASFADIASRPGPEVRVGTSSVRRMTQLRRIWNRARFEPVRGNLDTRLRKLDEGEYDLLILASAGLERLGRADRIGLRIPVAISVPAPGQGAIAVEIRRDDAATRELVGSINDVPTLAAVSAERALVVGLGGGCQTPIGALAMPCGDELRLQAAVASLDGHVLVRAEARGAIDRPGELGTEVAKRLDAQGARDILREAERGI